MKQVFILFIFVLGYTFAFSQGDYDDELPPSNNDEFVGFDNSKKSKKGDRQVNDKQHLERMRIGGTAGFGFSNGLLSLNLSPLFGYQVVKERIEIGAGANYDFFRFTNRTQRYQENTIGPVVYLRVYIWEGIFVQARAVYLKSYVKQIDNRGTATSRTTKAQGDFKNVFGAAGYSIPMGGRAWLNVGLEVNLIKYDLSRVNANNPRVFSPFINFQIGL